MPYYKRGPLGSTVEPSVAYPTGTTPLYNGRISASTATTYGDHVHMNLVKGGRIFVRLGRRSASSAGAALTWTIEEKPTLNGGGWAVLNAAVSSTLHATAGSTAVVTSAQAAANQKVLLTADTQTIAAGDVIFIDDNGQEEFATVASVVSNTSITLTDPLLYTHAASTTIYNKAEIFAPVVVPDATYAVRAVIAAGSYTKNFFIQIVYVGIEETYAGGTLLISPTP